MAERQAALLSSGSQFSLSIPLDALNAASQQNRAAASRLEPAAGGALVMLALFIVLAGAGLRREQLSELESATRTPEHRGSVGGLHSRRDRLVRSRRNGSWLPRRSADRGTVGGRIRGAHCSVLTHSLLTSDAAIVITGAWLASTVAIASSALARGGGAVDVLAVASIALIVGGLGAGAGVSGSGALLLAPACCVAAGVIVFRGMSWVSRGSERLARRGPVASRAGAVTLAAALRCPLAIAFLAVSIGLGGFGLAYRATLSRGTADQAANGVPLDALVAPGPKLDHPVLAGAGYPLAGARGGACVPRAPDRGQLRERRRLRDRTGLAVSGRRPGPHAWMAQQRRVGATFGSGPATARRPPGPVRVPGPELPRGARTLSLAAFSPTLALGVTADLRDAQGAVTQLPAGDGERSHATSGRPAAPLGGGKSRRWSLMSPRVSPSPTLTRMERTRGRQRNYRSITLGPLVASAASERPVMSVVLSGWTGVGAASSDPIKGRPAMTAVRFQSTGQPGVLRPSQPIDSRPVPVLADPQTAAAAGPGGRLALTVDELPGERPGGGSAPPLPDARSGRGRLRYR